MLSLPSNPLILHPVVETYIYRAPLPRAQNTAECGILYSRMNARSCEIYWYWSPESIRRSVMYGVPS